MEREQVEVLKHREVVLSFSKINFNISKSDILKSKKLLVNNSNIFKKLKKGVAEY